MSLNQEFGRWFLCLSLNGNEASNACRGTLTTEEWKAEQQLATMAHPERDCPVPVN
jgi:hypothetical protein